MKKIVIAQFYTKNLSYGKFSEEINKKYCEEKGYTYHVEKDTDKIKTYIEDRAHTWAKPKLILEVMEKYDCDYVLFLDMDAVVSDNTIRIEEFIDDDFDLIATEDYSSHSKMNAGVLLFKNSEWSRNFMNDWWEAGNYLRGGDCSSLSTNNNQEGYFKNNLWHDQTCLTVLYDRSSNVKNKVKIITNRSLNWREYNDGNFIFHAFGYGHIRNRKIDKIYYDVFNIKMDPNNKSLADISEFYHTDKESSHKYISNYYEDLFNPIKENLKRFCEIGTDGESLKMWRDFFNNAEIIGCDINPIKINEKRINFVQMDQSKEEDLEKFALTQEDFDVILDDASHKMRDQQITFAKLFRKLKPGGLFIIENLQTSHEAKMSGKQMFNWGDPNKTTTLEMLQNLILLNNNVQSDYISDADKEYLKNNIDYCKLLYERGEELSSVTSVIKKRVSPSQIEKTSLEDKTFANEDLSNSNEDLHSANYGGKDVKDILTRKMINGSLSIVVGNELFGDPNPGVFKSLVVNYKNETMIIPEGKKLVLGKKDFSHKSLSDISKKYPTDKDFTHNYYESVYEEFFYPIKDNVKLVCEIGIGGFLKEAGWEPGNSLRVWRDYFKNAQILGLDIVRHQLRDLERITIDWLDQSKKELVSDYAAKLREYDIIIDDGSHNIHDQQITFASFMKSLKSGGLFIIEDLHSSIEVKIPEKRDVWGWGDPTKITTLELLENFIDKKEIISDYLDEEEKEYLKNNIKSIQIFKLGPTSITSVIVKT